jgi:hypothetical protein
VHSHFFLPRAGRVGKVARNAKALRDGRGFPSAKGPHRLARTDVRAIHLPHSLREQGRKGSNAQSHFFLPRAARVGKVARNASSVA